jgi:hypothetical protein
MVVAYSVRRLMVSTAHCKTLTLGAAEFCNSGRRLFKTRISLFIFCLPFLSVSLCFSRLSWSLLFLLLPRGEEGGEERGEEDVDELEGELGAEVGVAGLDTVAWLDLE